MNILFIIMLVLLTSCHLFEKGKDSGSNKLKVLSIIASTNRYSELEAYGCTLRDLGGIAREANLLSLWRKNNSNPSLYLNAGTTFAPVPQTYSQVNKKNYQERAKFIVELLNRLKLNYLGPTAEDLVLGVNTLKGLEKAAKFKWVSTNLWNPKNKKPLFKQYFDISKGDIPTLILGLSGNPDPRYGNLKVEVQDPIKSLNSIFKILPKKERFVILLSSLSQKSLRKVIKKFPMIHVVVGGAEKEYQYFAKRIDKKNIYVNPLSRGRNVALLNFGIKLPFGELIDEDDITSKHRVHSVTDKTKIHDLAFFRWTFINVSARYDLPKNKIHKLFTKKAAVSDCKFSD